MLCIMVTSYDNTCHIPEDGNGKCVWTYCQNTQDTTGKASGFLRWHNLLFLEKGGFWSSVLWLSFIISYVSTLHNYVNTTVVALVLKGVRGFCYSGWELHDMGNQTCKNVKTCKHSKAFDVQVTVYHDQFWQKMVYGICRMFAESKPVWHIPLLCVRWKIPDDGQRNCPKHVEFYSKNKFEKLMHLVGFVIRTQKPSCNDAFHNCCSRPNHIQTMPHSIIDATNFQVIWL